MKKALPTLGSFESGSKIDLLLGMTPEVPARLICRVRKKRTHEGLCLGFFGNVFGVVPFLGNLLHDFDLHGVVRGLTAGEAQAQPCVIGKVEERGSHYQSADDAEKSAFHMEDSIAALATSSQQKAVTQGPRL